MCQASHHTSHKPLHKMRLNPHHPIKAPMLSVLASQCFAAMKCHVEKQTWLFYHCVLIVHKCIYDMEQYIKCISLVPKWSFSQICKINKFQPVIDQVTVLCSLFSDWGYKSDDYNGGTCVIDTNFADESIQRINQQCTSG